tara:strand:+ start:1867 stop:1986 length:120 start_codon:yes stop_codon:yes gene_type:complete
MGSLGPLNEVLSTTEHPEISLSFLSIKKSPPVSAVTVYK